MKNATFQPYLADRIAYLYLEDDPFTLAYLYQLCHLFLLGFFLLPHGAVGGIPG